MKPDFDNPKTYHVFVYGTLKGMTRGKFLGMAETVDQYILMNGGFPMAADIDAGIGDPNHAGRILGEAHEVSESEVRGLDMYEGTNNTNTEKGSFYIRKEVPIKINDIEMTAWMYFGAEAKQMFESHSQCLPNDLGVVSWPFSH